MAVSRNKGRGDRKREMKKNEMILINIHTCKHACRRTYTQYIYICTVHTCSYTPTHIFVYKVCLYTSARVHTRTRTRTLEFCLFFVYFALVLSSPSWLQHCTTVLLITAPALKQSMRVFCLQTTTARKWIGENRVVAAIGTYRWKDNKQLTWSGILRYDWQVTVISIRIEDV